MDDTSKTRQQLIEELQALRAQIHSESTPSSGAPEPNADNLLKSISNISNSILAHTDLDDLLDSLSKEVITASLFRSLTIFLVHYDTKTIQVARRIHKNLTIIKNTYSLPLNTQNIVGDVVRTNQITVIDGWDDRFAIDVSITQDHNAQYIPELYDKTSYFVPISQGTNVIALIATASAKSEREHVLHRIQMLQPLFNQLAIAIRYAQQTKQLESQVASQTTQIENTRSYLKTFQDINNVLLNTLDVDTLLDTFAEQLLLAGMFRAMTISLVDRTTHTVSVVREVFKEQDKITSNNLSQSPLGTYNLSNTNKVIPLTVQTGELQIIESEDDPRLDPSRKNEKSWGDKVAFFCPIKIEEQVVAVFATGCPKEQKQETLNRIHFLQPLTNHVAITLKHAQLHQTLQEQARIQELNLHISQAVQKMVNKEDIVIVLQTCLEKLQTFKPNICSLAIHRILTPNQTLVETFRVDNEGLIPQSTHRIMSSIIDCWKKGQIIHEWDLENNRTQDIKELRAKLRNHPIRSLIDIPFDRGILSIHSSSKKPFSEQDQTIFHSITDTLSLGLARIEDLSYLQQQNQRQNILLQITRAVQSMLHPNDLTDVLATIHEQLRLSQINFVGLSIHHVLKPEELLVKSYRAQPDGTFADQIRERPGVINDWRKGQNIYRPNLEENKEGLPVGYLQNTYKTFNKKIQSMLNVPFEQGVLVLRSIQKYAYSQQDIRFIEQVAQTISIGLTRAQDLADKEAQFQELENVYQFSPIGLFVIDRDLRLLRFNERLAALNGLEQKDVGRTLYDIIPDQIQNREQQFKQIFETGESVRYNKINGYTPHEPDKPKTWLASYYPLRSNTGEVERILGAVVDITEQEQIREELEENQRKLKQSEQNLRQTLAGVPIGIILTNAHSEIIQTNPASLDLLGLTEEELLGKTALDPDWNATRQDGSILDPYDFPIPTAIRTKKSIKNTYMSVFRPKTQDRIDLIVNADVQKDENDNINTVICSFLDITELRKTTEALQRSEALLQATGQMAHVGGWSRDAKTLKATWTDEVYRILDLPVGQEVSLDKSIQFYAPEVRPIIQKAVKNCLDQGVGWDLELPLITAKNRRIWVRAIGQAEVKDGKTVRIYGYFQDITERRKAAQAIQESERQYRTILQNALDGIVSINQQGKIIAWNDQAQKIFGWSFEDVQGKKLTETIIPPKDRKVQQEGLERFLKTGQTAILNQRIETQAQHKNGHTIPVELSVVSLQLESEYIFTGFIRDITERKQIEEERLRTQRLRALGEMAAGISHNLNNILTGILGPAQMLQLKLNEPDVLEDVDTIFKAGQRAREIVSRLNRGWRTDIEELEATNINAVIQEAIQTSRPRWKDEPESRGIHIELHTHLGDVPHIQGTQADLHDIVINMIFNAVDAMPKGGHLSFTTTHNQDEVRLIVTDTGMGISQENLERIFDPFFTTKGEVGTGLGLSTVYGTINRWGGNIQVSSIETKGTTFILDFAAWNKESATQTSQATSQTTARMGRILVVEDDEIVTRVLSRALSDHQIDTFASGTEALNAFEPQKYDLLITDLGLPQIPGDQLAKQCLEKDPQLVTILISGWHLLPNDPRRKHFDFFIQKPFHDLDNFSNIITGALEKRHAP